MPRFYLHVCNGNGFTEDEEGPLFADLGTARLEAIRSLRQIMGAEMENGELNLGSFIEIEDEARELVMTFPFEEAVNVSRIKGERPQNRSGSGRTIG